MSIKLKHPYISNYWINRLSEKQSDARQILVIETPLEMDSNAQGFVDDRFPDLLNYLSEETKPYWSSLSDIEIRTRTTIH